MLQQRLQLLLALSRQIHDLFQGAGLAQAHFQGHLGFLIGQQQGKAPVFRVVLGQLFQPQLVGDAVGDHVAQLEDDLSGLLVFYKIRHKISKIIGHCQSPFHCCTWLSSQAASGAMPSPVLALMGKIRALGLRIWMYSVHFSRSKSK